MAERGIIVSYEAIRLWCLKFGPEYARKLRRKEGRGGDIWHVDELLVRIQGTRLYLWRAVDQDGDVLVVRVEVIRSLGDFGYTENVQRWTREAIALAASL